MKRPLYLTIGMLLILLSEVARAGECNETYDRYLQLAERANTQSLPSFRFLINAAEACPSVQAWMSAGARALDNAETESAVTAFLRAAELAHAAGDVAQQALGLARYASGLFDQGLVTPASNYARAARELSPDSEEIRTIGRRIDAFIASKGLDGSEVMRSMNARFPTPDFLVGAKQSSAVARTPTSNRGAPSTDQPSSPPAVFRIPDLRINFVFARPEIDAPSRASLDSLIGILNELAGAGRRFQLEAHSDERGRADHNWALSERRAQFAFDQIVNRSPTLAARLSLKPMGESQPRYRDARDEVEHRLNRRLEVIIE